MRIAVGSDDVYHVSKVIVEHFRSRRHEVEELGALRSGNLSPGLMAPGRSPGESWRGSRIMG
jgi:hypothetical protein